MRLGKMLGCKSLRSLVTRLGIWIYRDGGPELVPERWQTVDPFRCENSPFDDCGTYAELLSQLNTRQSGGHKR